MNQGDTVAILRGGHKGELGTIQFILDGICYIKLESGMEIKRHKDDVKGAGAIVTNNSGKKGAE